MTCWSSHKYIREGLNFVEGFVHLATLTLFRQRRGGFRASTDLLSSIISKPLSYESNISHSKIFWFFFSLAFCDPYVDSIVTIASWFWEPCLAKLIIN